MKNRIILIIAAIIAIITATSSIKAPEGVLGYPFTPVVEGLELREDASLDAKIVGKLPLGRKYCFREHGQSDAWIFIDDYDTGIQGWILSDGGYLGDNPDTTDPEYYESALSLTIKQLREDPHSHDRDTNDEGYSDYEDNGISNAPVDKSTDSDLDKAISAKLRKDKGNIGGISGASSVIGKILEWTILLLILLVFAGRFFVSKALKYNVGRFLALAGVAEVLYALNYPVFNTFSRNSFFSMFLLGLVQILFTVILRQNRIRPKWNTAASIIGMAAVLTSAVLTCGAGKVFGSILGGILNIIIGVVVVIAIYGTFKDGFESGGSKSASSSGSGGSGRTTRSCSSCRHMNWNLKCPFHEFPNANSCSDYEP